MKLKTLSTAMILATVPMTGAFAAALDRSGQSISAFLQPGNYFEAGISVLDPSVSGKIKGTNISVGEMADDYQLYNTALKLQLTPNFSFGLIYDQPFGAAATYPTGQGAPLFWDPTGTTKVEVETQNLSLILGFQPTENWNIYGGGVYQTVKGNVELHGAAYSGSLLAPTANFSGYKENIGEDSAAGWLAGVAYQIPEIALKASLTYRSEIEHSVVVQESSTSSTAGIAGLINLNNGKGSTDITTPQSVNLDFQTGIMADTVAFANIRWVEWSKFAIRPYAFGKASVAAGASPTINKPNGFDLVAYTDDQISATVGVGRKLSEKWAGTVAVGYDTGAGNPVSTLGPTEGYWNVGLGLQFSPAPNYFIAGGVKYFMLGDAKAQSGAQFNTPAYVADFNDNDAWAYGLKIGYKF